MGHRVLIGIVAAAFIAVVALAFIAAYPATVAGVHPVNLGRSVQAQTRSPSNYSADMPPRCARHGEVWLCERYLVEVDWRGCWEARQFIGPNDARAFSTVEAQRRAAFA